MSLTLNIIVHELALFGRVECTCGGNPSFQSARLFLEGRAFASGILYVCQTYDEVDAVHAAGCHAVFAGEGTLPEAVAQAATVVVRGDASALEVFDALLETFSRYSAWEAAMDRVCQTGGSLQDLIDASEPFLKNNVVVLDPALKLLGYTRGVPCDDPITMELIEHGYHTEDNIRKFKLHKRFKPWAEARGFVVNDTREICKYTTVVRSFTSHSSFSLIVVMMCNKVEPKPYLLDMYEMFVERVGFYALRDYPGNKPSGNVVDTFLKDLLSGQVKDEDAVAERCRYAGIPPEARFRLYYLAADDSPVPSHRLLADVSRVVAPAKTILMDRAVVVLSFDSIIGSLCLWNEPREARGSKNIDARLGSLLQRHELEGGKSAAFVHLSQAPIAFEQARLALELGCKAYGVQGASRQDGLLFCFDDCAVAFVASLLSSSQVDLLAMTRAGALLKAIAQADAQSHTDNYSFLYAYLLYERRTSIVAEKLHMHRNNVNYRIGRIEQQFGINTEDPAVRIELLEAYRLREALIGRNAQ